MIAALFDLPKRHPRLTAWAADILFTLVTALLVATTLGIAFLNSNNWPTGGDAASHLLYAKLYADELLLSGQILPWVPEVFGGLPFLSYYFPLPFIVISALSKMLGLASAFKWGSFLAAMLLPGAVFMCSRRWLGFTWLASLFGAIGTLAFIFHEQNSIWGGNLLSTLSGEFAYSYGVFFAVLSMMAWARAINLGRGWLLAALLEAASGFSHGFPLLVLGFSTGFLLLDGLLSGSGKQNFTRFKLSLSLLLRGHLLAFALLGGWLWPMLEMHGLTIPNDGASPISSWRELVPAALWPALYCGLLGLLALVFPGVRRGWSDAQRRALCYFISAIGLTAVAFAAGNQLGLADVRFFPIIWLLGAIACGWLAGQALSTLDVSALTGLGLTAAIFAAGDYFGFTNLPFLTSFAGLAEAQIFSINMYQLDGYFFTTILLLGAMAGGWFAYRTISAMTLSSAGPDDRWPALARALCGAAACLGLLGWLGAHINQAPDWGLWNHSGLDAKPQWRNLSKLFPDMTGNLWSPRLAFEHDPANNDVGSTRTLEALPMFLNHRPVLEGLYMETAVLGPAVYQVQSEVSTHPSSPLARFPSGSLDPEFAAKHMNFLHSDTLLLRSVNAQSAIEASGFFTKIAASPPFAVYRVKNFDSHLAQVVTAPLKIRPQQDWMQDAFTWFRSRHRFDKFLPVYADNPADQAVISKADGMPKVATAVREKSLSRHEMVFETDAIGRPHLIKIGYHLRWQLASKGSMHIAGPGFMLVIPQEKEIRLVYGHTLIGKIGIAATILAALVALFLIWRGFRQPAPAVTPTGVHSTGLRLWLPIVAGWLLLTMGGMYFAIRSPERSYNLAWESMNAGQHKEASQRFLTAYQLRRPPAKKEEALFWMAKASEQAGNRVEAKARYRELFDHYHGYWVPESLYTYIRLEQQDGHAAAVAPLVIRLREEYPTNQWALKLDQPQ